MQKKDILGVIPIFFYLSRFATSISNQNHNTNHYITDRFLNQFLIYNFQNFLPTLLYFIVSSFLIAPSFSLWRTDATFTMKSTIFLIKVYLQRLLSTEREPRRRTLKYDISVDDQTEVDPREHDWRFNLNIHGTLLYLVYMPPLFFTM